ncbi:MAG TPA: homoserine kinase [Gemmatimonadales bacterium]
MTDRLRNLAVRVPGSTSNLGAGFDCLGLALDLWLEAELVPGSGRPKYKGTVSGLDGDTDLVYRMLAERDAFDGYRLTVQSSIPIGRGLGSSAAALVAGLALARLAEGDPLDLEAIYRGATIEEGHPDNAGPAVFGGLVLAAQSAAPLPFHGDLAVALAVPEKSISTKAARDLVPTAFPRETAIAQATRSAALVIGLTTGDPDLIRFGMDDRLAVPHRKGLIEGFDSAVRAALVAGAHGVTISGAGSALVAIVPSGRQEQVAEAMAAALVQAGNAAVPATPAIATEGLQVVSE